MLNPHEYRRQRSLGNDIFRTQISLPLLNANKRKARNMPLHLPQINQKNSRHQFYDQLTLSPEYVKISKNEEDQSSSSRMKSSRMESSKESTILYSSRRKEHSVSFDFGSRILPLQILAMQDRVVQKYEQNDQKYKKLISNIKKRVRSNHQKQNKKGIELIYEKLLKIL